MDFGSIDGVIKRNIGIIEKGINRILVWTTQAKAAVFYFNSQAV